MTRGNKKLIYKSYRITERFPTEKRKNSMTYLTTNFREFVKNQIIQETKKESVPVKPKELVDIKQSSGAWIEALQEKFNEIWKDKDKEYDNLYK